MRDDPLNASVAHAGFWQQDNYAVEGQVEDFEARNCCILPQYIISIDIYIYIVVSIFPVSQYSPI